MDVNCRGGFMGNARRFSLVMFFCVISFLLISVKDVSYSQDAKEVDVKAVAIDQKDEIEKLEEKENQKKEEIKQKEEDLDQIQKEAQKANEEKIKAEGAVLLKQQEANVAKEKAEAVKKEAEVREDDVLLREAKRLEGEAEKIKEQADVEREALKMVEIQERLALQKLDANQKKIEELKEAIQGIKREKSLKRSWAEKLSVSGVSVVIGIALFFLLNFVIARLGKIFVKTNDIREDELSLRINTIARLLHWLGSFVIFGIVASMILETFGVSLGPLLAGAGIVGLAFGFGGQYLIRDLINGLFILIEDRKSVV